MPVGKRRSENPTWPKPGGADQEATLRQKSLTQFQNELIQSLILQTFVHLSTWYDAELDRGHQLMVANKGVAGIHKL